MKTRFRELLDNAIYRISALPVTALMYAGKFGRLLKTPAIILLIAIYLITCIPSPQNLAFASETVTTAEGEAGDDSAQADGAEGADQESSDSTGEKEAEVQGDENTDDGKSGKDESSDHSSDQNTSSGQNADQVSDDSQSNNSPSGNDQTGSDQSGKEIDHNDQSGEDNTGKEKKEDEVKDVTGPSTGGSGSTEVNAGASGELVYRKSTRDNSYTIKVTGDKDSGIYNVASMNVLEVNKNDSIYADSIKKLNKGLIKGTDGVVKNIHLYHIMFCDKDGKHVTLDGKVDVKITYREKSALKLDKNDKRSAVRAFSIITSGDRDAEGVARHIDRVNKEEEEKGHSSTSADISVASLKNAATTINNLTKYDDEPIITIMKANWAPEKYITSKIIRSRVREISYPLRKDGLTGIAITGTEEEKKEENKTETEPETTESDSKDDKEKDNSDIDPNNTEKSTEATTEAAPETATEATTEAAPETATEATTEAAPETATEATTEDKSDTEAGNDKKHSLTATDGNCNVVLSYNDDANIPEGATLSVKEIKRGTEEYSAYINQTESVYPEKEDASIKTARFFDIKILDKDGNEVEPAAPVSVNINFNPMSVEYKDTVDLIHFEEGKKKDETKPEIIQGVNVHNGDRRETIDGVDFEAEKFSVYGVVSTILTKTLKASDGKTYTVKVTFDNTCGIPDNAELSVVEIKEGEEGYDEYVARTAEKLGAEIENLNFAKALDIKLVDPATAEKYQPTKNVKVSIKLTDQNLKRSKEINVVHFEDTDIKSGGSKGPSKSSVKKLDSKVEGGAVEFLTDGFSVYVVVDNDQQICTYTFYTFNPDGYRTAYMFETESGDLTSTLTVKGSEKLSAPQNPSNPNDPDSAFIGWYKPKEGGSINVDGHGTPELEDRPFDFDAEHSSTVTNVDLYARFSTVNYVRFHGYATNGSTFTSPVIKTMKMTEEDDPEIKMWDEDHNPIFSAGYEDRSGDNAFPAYQFIGWAEADSGIQAGSMPEGISIIQDTYTVTKTVDLYPVFQEIRWLIPVSGNAGTGARYYPPVSFPATEGRGDFSDFNPCPPTRPGYDFVGWCLKVENEGIDSQNGTENTLITDNQGVFLDAYSNYDNSELGVRIVNKQLYLSKNVRIYARWTPKNNVRYTIAIWKQLLSENQTTDPADRQYEFVESFELSGTADETININDTDFNDYRTLNTEESFNKLSHAEEITFAEYEHYVYYRADPVSKTIKGKGNRVFNLYYDNTDEPIPIVGNYTLKFKFNDGITNEKELSPSTPLSSLVPDDPVKPDTAPEGFDTGIWPQGYDFYWYIDPGHTTRVFFVNDEVYQNYDENKVLYENMPNHDLTVYGQWGLRRFRVNIDPNYGELASENQENGQVTGNGSTWFNVDYGERIEEYTHVTRNYVPSKSGNYYYVNHNSPRYTGDRFTYYTTNLDKATELTTYKYAPDNYSGQGWYEVTDEAEKNEKYDFSTPVDHETTLRMRWKRSGTFYLEYNPDTELNGKPMQGTLLNGQEASLEDGYNDKAVIFLTGQVNPPEGYEFIGWRVRGEEKGKIYYPGSDFVLPAEYAVTVSGKQRVYLDAVYSQVKRAKIIYNANKGVINPDIVDFGAPLNDGVPTVETSVSEDGTAATISNLVNNSPVRLSSGEGFSRTDPVTQESFVLNGWYQIKNGIVEHYGLGADHNIYVDTDEPVTLYADWKAKVHFDKNSNDASFDTNWADHGYTLDNQTGRYYILADVDKPLSEPSATITLSGSLSGQNLDFWSTEAGENADAFRFNNTPVTASMTLYAHYSDAAMVSFQVLEKTGTEENLVYTPKPDWQVTPQLRVTQDKVLNMEADEDKTPNDLISYVQNIPDDYRFEGSFVGYNPNTLTPITAVKRVNGNVMVTKNGTDTTLENGEQIYLVYTPKQPLNEKNIKVSYVKESANGAISNINPLRYNGSNFSMNGVAVSQDQEITVKVGETIAISQEGTNYHMPPLLDEGEDRLNLVYNQIGFGKHGSSNVSQLGDNNSSNISSDRMLYLKIENNRLIRSFDNINWTECTEEEPTVYAIYEERGFDLTVKKTVTGEDTGIDPNRKFKVIISSSSITQTSYEAEGTGYTSVEATPAKNSQDGTIVLSLKHGDSFIIKGLSKGNYTIVEQLPDTGFVMRAKVDGGEIQEVNPTIHLQKDDFTSSMVELTNTPKYICQIVDGDTITKFYTLNRAVEYAGQNYSGNAEIEMLIPEYSMPSSDAVVIPEGYNIKLTTQGTEPCVIIRDSSFNNGVMFTSESESELTLNLITLDGGCTDSQTEPHVNAPVIRNSGTLTVSQDAVLRNTFSSRDGGAVYSTGALTLKGTFSNNQAANGGAVYAPGGSVTIDGGSFSDNKATSNGGAIYYGGSGAKIQISNVRFTKNEAIKGNGGAIYAVGGSFVFTGSSLSENEALKGSGGGVYVRNAIINVDPDSSVSENKAKKGGGIYAEAGEITVTGEDNKVQISDNRATESDGGGIYLGRGELTLNDAKMTKNKAEKGNGGAIFTDDGILTFSGNTVLGGSDADANTAQNGSAVYVNTGTAKINDSTAINYNKAVQNQEAELSDIATGGAIGVGSINASIIISYNTSDRVKIYDNKAEVKDESITGILFPKKTVQSNIYLNQDSESILSFEGDYKSVTDVDNNCKIGIYVPGQFESDLFKHRGTVTARFGGYVSANADRNDFKKRIKNDRLDKVEVNIDKTTEKLFWYKSFKVTAYSLNDDILPDGTNGSVIGTPNQWYAPPSNNNKLSNVADDFIAVTGINTNGKLYAGSYIYSGTRYVDYISEINWDDNHQKWIAVKGDGVTETYPDSDPSPWLKLYFASAVYLSIENNDQNDTKHKLDLTKLEVKIANTWKSVLNNNTGVKPYGFVTAKNGMIQSALEPIDTSKYELGFGESLKLLLPGAVKSQFKLMGSFDPDNDDTIKYTVSSITGDQTTSANVGLELEDPETQTNKKYKLPDKDKTYEIIIGARKPVCKIVTDSEITGASGFLYKELDGNKCEYLFTKLSDAVNFTKNHISNHTSDIELLVDYMITNADDVSIPEYCKITFKTAISGKNQYPALVLTPEQEALTDDEKNIIQASRRATLSRDTSNKGSLIKVPRVKKNPIDYPGVLPELTVLNLIIDGKNVGGDSEGGVVSTDTCKVNIDHVYFKGCQAKNGGALYVRYSNSVCSDNGIGAEVKNQKGTEWGNEQFTVTNSVFESCVSNSTSQRQGGGAIWTNAKTLSVTGSNFIDCVGADQGGAIFHRIDTTGRGNYGESAYAALVMDGEKVVNPGSTTSLSECTFTHCQSRSGGAMESDAHTVNVRDCLFENCNSIKLLTMNKYGSGGALSTYIYEKDSYVSWDGDKYKTSLTVTGSTFRNCTSTGNNENSGFGGSIRSHSSDTLIEDCSFFNSTATSGTIQTGGSGGAICVNNDGAKKLTVRGCTIDNGTASKGGGIYCSAPELILEDYDLPDDYESEGKGEILYDSDNNPTKRCNLIKNCTSTYENGGGIAHRSNSKDDKNFLLTKLEINSVNTRIMNNRIINNNKSGGGIYTRAKTVNIKGCTIEKNIATSNGGGVCQNVERETDEDLMTIDSSIIRDNRANNQGGGVYTWGLLTLRNDTQITGNILNSTNKDNAAGVYLKNRILTVGDASKANDPSYVDTTSVKDNVLSSGEASNLRLRKNNNNTENHRDSVNVLCSLGGEIRVIFAARKLTVFGDATCKVSASRKFKGFANTDSATIGQNAFIADDGSLFSVYNRRQSTSDPDADSEIIWRGDVICKITEPSGETLYLDEACNEPAIFDRLDFNEDGSPASAFSYLRQNNPPLYRKNPKEGQNKQFYLDGADNSCSIKLLVPTINVAEQNNTNGKPLNSTGEYPNRTITLTTADRLDTEYPYRGSSGTYSVIKGSSGKTIIESKSNIALRNVILDGGGKGIEAVIQDAGKHVEVKLEKNAIIRNCSTTGDGGGVNMKNSSLIVNGGSIYNCSANQGGGVYHKEIGNVALQNGTISACTATKYGGGVFFTSNNNSYAFAMSGGSIIGCHSKDKGGGVYVPNSKIMDMSGGSITGNSAVNVGGGIATGDKAKLYFSGRVTVYNNTMGGKACNVQLDYNSNDVIYSYSKDNSTSLGYGSKIGVYVSGTYEPLTPDDISRGYTHHLGDGTYDTVPYKGHGAENEPFGQWDNKGNQSDKDAHSKYLHCFVNDRNGLKGSRKEGTSDSKIYWKRIFALEVRKQVLSDLPVEMDNDTFRFRVRFYKGDSNISQYELPSDKEFTLIKSNDDAEYTIHSGETVELKNGQYITVDNLPEYYDGEKLHYEVEELHTREEVQDMFYSYYPYNLKYKTTTYNSSGNRSNDYTIRGFIGDNLGSTSGSQALSVAAYTNQKAVVKLTYDDNLLYYRNAQGNWIPAVYSELYLAYNQLNNADKDSNQRLSYRNRYTGQWMVYDPDESCKIEMLVPEYTMNQEVGLDNNRIAVLTTARNNASDGYPYSGQEGTKAKILRGSGFNNKSMLTAKGDLTLTNIAFDGNNNTSSADGGIVKVPAGGTLTIADHVVINHSRTTGNGAGVYVAENGKLKINGNPDFGGPGVYTDADQEEGIIPTGKNVGDIRTDTGNFCNKDLANDSKNGGKTYILARQDIYIAGYQGSAGDTNVQSLVVTGKITSGKGSIWVWAEKSPHYKSTEQFAKFDDSLIKTVSGKKTVNLNEDDLTATLEAFRNAQTDAETGAGMTGNYLYGMTKEDDETRKNIYWNGNSSRTRVMLTKVLQTESGNYQPLPNIEFEIYTNAAMTGSKATGTIEKTVTAGDGSVEVVEEAIELNRANLKAGVSGAVFIGYLDTGDYYMKEFINGAEVTDKHFRFTVSEEGITDFQGTETIKTINLIPN